MEGPLLCVEAGKVAQVEEFSGLGSRVTTEHTALCYAALLQPGVTQRLHQSPLHLRGRPVDPWRPPRF